MEEIQQPILKTASEASRSLKNDTLDSKKQNALQSPIFTKLNNLTQQQKIEIIQTRNRVPFAKPGFQLQAEGKLSLKRYYESKD